jgi:hypothetical protein
MKKVFIDEMHDQLLQKIVGKMGKGETFAVQRGILLLAEHVLESDEVDKIIDQYYPDETAAETKE